MSNLQDLKNKLLENPTLVHPEAELILEVFSQLEELEKTIALVYAETEESKLLKLELERAKDELSDAIFLTEPLIIPELPEETTNVNL
jgi:hypothetical protein